MEATDQAPLPCVGTSAAAGRDSTSGASLGAAVVSGSLAWDRVRARSIEDRRNETQPLKGLPKQHGMVTVAKPRDRLRQPLDRPSLTYHSSP